jgi:hypothetical protein
MTPTSRSADIVAGYRLVRRLGAGTRAEVYLGVAQGHRTAQGRTAAIKVFRQSTPPASIASELEALSAVQSLPAGVTRHAVRLVDVAHGRDGVPVAVLSRVSRGSVAQLLTARSEIPAGEAVTLLAPLAATLPLLHGAGVAHCAITAASVHFGDAGEPVILGFGHAVVRESGLSDAALDAEPAVVADRERLAVLALFVLERVRPTRATADLLGWLDGRPSPATADFARELEQRLFDCATALPVEFGGQAEFGPVARVGGAVDRGGGGIPARVGGWAEAPPAEVRRPESPPNAGTSIEGARIEGAKIEGAKIEGARIERPSFGVAPATGPPALARPARVRHSPADRPWTELVLGARPFAAARVRLAGSLASRRRAPGPTAAGDPARGAPPKALAVGGAAVGFAAVVAAVRAARRRFWLAAGAVAVALCVAAILPSGGPSAEHRASLAGSSPAPSGTPVPSRTPLPTRTPSTSTSTSTSGDPVLALPVLLAARDRCFHDLSVLCLDTIEQQGSAALSADRARIAGIVAGGEEPAGTALTAGHVELVERLGDSALVRFGAESNPASALMIRGEAGWLMREVIQQ